LGGSEEKVKKLISDVGWGLVKGGYRMECEGQKEGGCLGNGPNRYGP